MPDKLYTFSFDKKSAILLAASSLVLACLLITAGYLIGASQTDRPFSNAANSSGSPLAAAASTEPASDQPAALPSVVPKTEASQPGNPPETPDPEAPEHSAAGAAPLAAKPSAATPAREPGKADALVVSPGPPAEADAKAGEPATPPSEERPSRYSLQFESVQDRAAALVKIKELKAESITATLFSGQDPAGQTWFAVRTGAYPDLVSATKAARELSTQTGELVIVRPTRHL